MAKAKMAHGLVLRMKDYLENLDTKKGIAPNVKESTYEAIEDPEASSEEVQIIKSWVIVTRNPQNSRMEFFSLLRQTLLFMLSPKWSKCAKQNDLLFAFSSYYHKFSTITKNARAIYNAVLYLSTDPWKNNFFQWEDLFNEKITINDQSVQEYFSNEPEEIVLARVQSFVSGKNLQAAICLAKISFLYHSRIKKTLAHPESPLPNFKGRIGSFSQEMSKEGQASIDWFITVLQRTRSLSLLTKEVSQLQCHEGIEIICRLRRNPQSKKFTFTLLQIFLMQDMVKSSEYCCTKKLFSLFCIMHKELNSTERDIIESAEKIFAAYAPSSSHLYLFVDAMWEQFGTKFISLYTEFYIRGLTADVNHLEVTKSSEFPCDIGALENHIASMFAKLSTLFNNSHDEAARECMFSAFSIKPSKSKLYCLKKLNYRLQVRETEKSESSNNYELTFRDCTCSRICNGYCRPSTIDSDFVHPLLKKGIRNIPYSLVKDFVSILESVRCINLQYNSFNWQDGEPKLWDYLQYSPQVKDEEYGGSEPELVSNSSNVSKVNSLSEVPIDVIEKKVLSNTTVKRKSLSDGSDKSHYLDVGANIEVHSNDSGNKKIRISNRQTPIAKETGNLSNIPKVKVNDAIENVIRMSLADKVTKEQLSVFTNANTLNSPIDGGKALSVNSHSQQQSQHFSHLTQENVSNRINHNLQLSYVSKPTEKVNPTICVKDSGRPNVVVKTEGSFVHERDSHFQQRSVAPSYLIQKGAIDTAVDLLKPVKEKYMLPLPSYKDEHHRSDHKLSDHVPIPVKHMKGQPIKEYVNKDNSQDALNLSSTRHLQTQALPKFYLQTPRSAAQLPLNLKCNKKIIHSQRPVSVPLSRMNQMPPIQSKQVSNHGIMAHSPTLTNSVQPKEQADRNSVIQHTMQHLGIKIPNQLSISLNSNAVQQLRYQKDGSNLIPFKVNVPSVLKNNFHSANLVITRQPNSSAQSFTRQPSPSANSSLEKREVITIPGIIASPSSVIKSPTWENSSKFNNEEYRKVMQATSSSVKKAYSDPYENEQIPVKQQEELIARTEISKKETVYQIYKTKQIPNRYNILNKQQGNTIGKVNCSSPLSTSTTTPTSQSWYSAPYPKANMQGSLSSSYSGNSIPVNKKKYTDSSYSSDLTFEKPSSFSYKSSNTGALEFSDEISYSYKNPNYENSSNLNKLEPFDKSFVTHKKPCDPSQYSVINNQNQNLSSASSILRTRVTSTQSTNSYSHSTPNNLVLQTKHFSDDYATGKQLYRSNLPANSFSSSPVITTSSNVDSTLNCDTSQSSVSQYDPTLYSSPVLLEDDRGFVVFKVANSTSTTPTQRFHSQTISSNNFSNVCCSPLEVEPCQSCSQPVKSDNFDSFIASKHRCDLSSGRMSSNNQAYDGFKNKSEANRSFEEPYALFHDPALEKCACPVCSVASPNSDLKLHIEKTHPCGMTKQIDSNAVKIGRENLNFLDFETSLFDSVHQDCEKGLPKEVIEENNPLEVLKITQSEENTLKMCTDLQNNTPFDNIIECFEDVESSMPYADDSSCTFSEMLKDDLQNEFLTELRSSADNCATPEIENFKLDSSLVQNNNYESNNNLNEMLEFLNTEQSLPEEISQPPESFVKNLSFVDAPKDVFFKQEERTLHRNPKLKKNVYCKICERKFSRQYNLKKHINHFHPNANVNNSIGLWEDKTKLEISVSSPNIFDSYEPPVNEVNCIQNSTKIYKSFDNTDTTKIFDFDQGAQGNKTLQSYKSYISKNRVSSSISDAESGKTVEKLNDPKVFHPSGKKKVLKSPLKECIYCGKFLSTLYMKQHVSKMHSNVSKCESPTLKSHASQMGNASSLSAENNSFLSVSLSTQEDIDSNTCLSVSDALKPIEKYSDPKMDLKMAFNGQSCSSDFLCPISPKAVSGENCESNFKIVNKFPRSTSNSGHSTELGINLRNGNEYDLNLERDVNKFTCHLCFRNYTSQSYLNKHIRTYHGMQNANESIKNEQNIPLSPQFHHNVEFPSYLCSADVSEQSFTEENHDLLIKDPEKSLIDVQLDSSSSLYTTKEYNFQECLKQNELDIFNATPISTIDRITYESPTSPANASAMPLYQADELHIPVKVENCSTPHFREAKVNYKNSVYAVDSSEIGNTDFSIKNSNDNCLSGNSQFTLHNTNDNPSESNAACSEMHISNQKKVSSIRYSCLHCVKSYSSKKSLANHMKLKHDNMTAVKVLDNSLKVDSSIPAQDSFAATDNCPPNSKVEFQLSSSPTNLNQDELGLDESDFMKKRSNEKVKCKFCLKLYSNRGNLKTHMKNVHNYEGDKVNKSQCNICLEWFSNNFLKRHIKLIHGKPFITNDIAITGSAAGALSLNCNEKYIQQEKDIENSAKPDLSRLNENSLVDYQPSGKSKGTSQKLDIFGSSKINLHRATQISDKKFLEESIDSDPSSFNLNDCGDSLKDECVSFSNQLSAEKENNINSIADFTANENSSLLDECSDLSVGDADLTKSLNIKTSKATNASHFDLKCKFCTPPFTCKSMETLNNHMQKCRNANNLFNISNIEKAKMSNMNKTREIATDKDLMEHREQHTATVFNSFDSSHNSSNVVSSINFENNFTNAVPSSVIKEPLVSSFTQLDIAFANDNVVGCSKEEISSEFNKACSAENKYSCQSDLIVISKISESNIKTNVEGTPLLSVTKLGSTTDGNYAHYPKEEINNEFKRACIVRQELYDSEVVSVTSNINSKSNVKTLKVESSRLYDLLNSSVAKLDASAIDDNDVSCPKEEINNEFKNTYIAEKEKPNDTEVFMISNSSSLSNGKISKISSIMKEQHDAKLNKTPAKGQDVGCAKENINKEFEKECIADKKSSFDSKPVVVSLENSDRLSINNIECNWVNNFNPNEDNPISTLNHGDTLRTCSTLLVRNYDIHEKQQELSDVNNSALQEKCVNSDPYIVESDNNTLQLPSSFLQSVNSGSPSSPQNKLVNSEYEENLNLDFAEISNVEEFTEPESHTPLENLFSQETHSINVETSECTPSADHLDMKQQLSLKEVNMPSCLINTFEKETEGRGTEAELSKTRYGKCRLCHKAFKTMSSLSKHLNILHKVPVLKKESTNIKANYLKENDDELSPPCLSHHPDLDLISSSTNMLQCISEKENNSMCSSSKKKVVEIEKELPVLSNESLDQNSNTLQSSLQSTSIQQICVSASGLSVKNVHKKYKLRQFTKRKLTNSNNVIEITNPICSIIQNDIDIVHDVQSSCNLKCNLKDCDIKCRLEPTDDNNLFDDHSNLKTPVLPKCVIRVLKNKQNAVIYKIDNSNLETMPDDADRISESVQNKHIKNFKTKSQYARNYRLKLKRKANVAFSSVKSRIRCRKNKIFSKLLSPFSSNKHKYGMHFRSRKGYLKNSQLQKKNSKKKLKATRNASATLTFKDPKDVIAFLKEHKQPVVRLTRLKEISLETNSVKTNTILSANVPIPHCSIKCDKTPIVKLEKIDILNKLISKHSVPKDVSEHASNAHGSCEIPVNQTILKSHFHKKLTIPENTTVNVMLHQFEVGMTPFSHNLCNVNNADSSINQNYVDSDIVSEKKCMHSPVIKECRVILHKLII